MKWFLVITILGLFQQKFSDAFGLNCFPKPRFYVRGDNSVEPRFVTSHDFGKQLDIYIFNEIQNFSLECTSAHPIMVEPDLQVPKLFENVQFERKLQNDTETKYCYMIRFTFTPKTSPFGFHAKFNCRSICEKCNETANTLLLLIAGHYNHPILEDATVYKVDVTPDDHGEISLPCYVTNYNLCPHLYAITTIPPTNGTEFICLEYQIRQNKVYNCMTPSCSTFPFSFADGFKFNATMLSREYPKTVGNNSKPEFGCEVFIPKGPNLPPGLRKVNYNIKREPIEGAYFRASPSNFLAGFNEKERNYVLYGIEEMNLTCESNEPISFKYDRVYSFPRLTEEVIEGQGFFKYKIHLSGRIRKERAQTKKNPVWYAWFKGGISCVKIDTQATLFKWTYDYRQDIRDTGIFLKEDAIDCRTISTTVLYVLKCFDYLNCQLLQKYSYLLENGPRSFELQLPANNYVVSSQYRPYGDLPGRRVTKNEIEGIQHGIILCYGGNRDILTKEFLQVNNNLTGFDVLPEDAGMFIDITPQRSFHYVHEKIAINCAAIASMYYHPIIIETAQSTNSTWIENFGISDNPIETRSEISDKLIHLNSTYTIPSFSFESITCSAQLIHNAKWQKISKHFTLVEGKKPEVVLSSGDLIVDLDENLTLSCTIVAGDPWPSINWYKDNYLISSKGKLFREIYQNKSTIVLNFNPIQASHIGTYSCHAENIIGKSSAKMYLQLQNDYTTAIWVSLTVFFVMLLIVLGILHVCMKQRKKIRNLTKAEIDEFANGVAEIWALQPDEINSTAFAIPYNSRYEVPKELWVTDKGKILGQGAYGIVSTGYLKRGDHELLVAIKRPKQATDLQAFKALLSELKLMAYIGHHENLVALLAACTENIQNRDVLVGLEFCCGGNLLEALQKARLSFNNLFSDTPEVIYLGAPQGLDSANPATLDTTQLLKWAFHIAKGMEFLASKKIIHGDLAARNVLLKGKLAKIGDFGLSRHLNTDAVYVKKSTALLPWKWMAIESLAENTYSEKSDVWSFGVTLWEIFTLGQTPYPGKFWNKDFLDSLRSGTRFTQPDYASKNLFQCVILPTVKADVGERPTFRQLVEMLENLKL